MEPNQLSSQIIKAAINVHKELGPGLLESVYQSCMVIELRNMGKKVQSEVPLPIFYKGQKVHEEGFRLDLLVEDTIIVFYELKSGCFSFVKIVPQIKHTRISFLSKALILILLGFVIANLVGALTPPTGFDPLAYQLSTPQKYLIHHKIFPIPDSSQSHSPMGIEMLYTIALALNESIFAKLIHFSMGILIILIIIVFSNKFLKNQAISILAAMIFYTQPVVGKLSVMAKIDLGFTFYFILTVFAFFNWFYLSEGKDNRWLIVSSIFLGLTSASKLTGIILFPIFFIGILLKHYMIKNISFIVFGKAIWYSAIALLVVSPWYLKSFLMIGDPLYPYLSSILSGNHPVVHAHKTTLLQFLMLPWDLTFNIDKFLYGNTHALP